MSRDRQRWLILLGEIISYPEMCAEHGVTRSASASAPSLSAFFIIIFSKYERARSTGRDAAAVHSVLNFRPFLKMLSHARRGRPLPPGAEVHSTELKILVYR